VRQNRRRQRKEVARHALVARNRLDVAQERHSLSSITFRRRVRRKVVADRRRRRRQKRRGNVVALDDATLTGKRRYLSTKLFTFNALARQASLLAKNLQMYIILKKPT
jgi:hypothetical protein